MSSFLGLSSSTASITGSGGDGYVSFFTDSNTLAGDNDLYWDRVNNVLQTNRITDNGTDPLNLGTLASTAHSLGTGDVMVGGDLEVDGVAYFDNNLVVASEFVLWVGGVTTSSVAMKVNSSMDQFVMCVGSANAGRQIVIGGEGFHHSDFDHAVPTNPTVFIHSALNPDTDNSEWLSLSHDQTDGYMALGKGGLKIGGQIFSDLPGTLEPSGITLEIDWNDGNSRVIDLNAASGDVTLTLSNAKSGAAYTLVVIQGAVARNITWPASTKFAGGVTPTISTGEDDIDMVTLFWTGTEYLATIGQDFS